MSPRLLLVGCLGLIGVVSPAWAGLVPAQPVVAGGSRPAAPGKPPVMLDDESASEGPSVVVAEAPSVLAPGQGDVGEASGDAPAANEPKRSWLRPSRETKEPKAESDSSSEWSWSLMAFVVLGGLAGAALVMKVRRGAPAPWLPPAPVRVLSTTRLGPKSSLVTAEVYGRVLLLGVTEETVSELGWLDSSSDAEREPEGEDGTDGARAPSAPPAAEASRGFGQVFGNVFRAGERKSKEVEFRGNPNVAALIAARETRDVVTTNYSRATAGAERRSAPSPRPVEQVPARVETQVAGLVRRRR